MLPGRPGRRGGLVTKRAGSRAFAIDVETVAPILKERGKAKLHSQLLSHVRSCPYVATAYGVWPPAKDAIALEEKENVRKKGRRYGGGRHIPRRKKQAGNTPLSERTKILRARIALDKGGSSAMTSLRYGVAPRATYASQFARDFCNCLNSFRRQPVSWLKYLCGPS